MKQTELCRRLGLETPIIQAPMSGVTTPALVAAAAGAGALGSHGCAAFDAAALGEQAAAIRGLTNRPYNLNFFCHQRPVMDDASAAAFRDLLQPFFEEFDLGDVPPAKDLLQPYGPDHFEVLMADPPPVVSFHFGLPEDDLWRPLQARGAAILSSATTVAEARWLAERGVDAVVAQGAEAGGHRGTFLTEDYGSALVGTMALVPQVADAVDVPVIAAGGIADGRGVAAALALALGAQAAQIGTAFLLTEESAADATYRQALGRARDEDTQVTKAFSGRPARGIRNRYVDAMTPHEDRLPDFPLPYIMNAALRATAAKQGVADIPAHWSGQAASLARPGAAAALIGRLTEEADACIAGLAA